MWGSQVAGQLYSTLEFLLCRFLLCRFATVPLGPALESHQTRPEATIRDRDIDRVRRRSKCRLRIFCAYVSHLADLYARSINNLCKNNGFKKPSRRSLFWLCSHPVRSRRTG